MNIWDLIQTAVTLKAEEEIVIAQGDALEVGAELRVDFPSAEKINALLVKGHDNRRFRIEALVVKREQ